MNISELEARTGIAKQNIRFYEKKGLLHPVRNAENNYREYTEEDISTLQVIKILRKLDVAIEDIRRILEAEMELSELMGRHLSVLLKKQKELDASIDICKSLMHTDLDTLDVDGVLQKMEDLERKGGKFKSILNDYKKVVRAEERKRFSFKPDNMALTPAEFTEALFQYANENNLNLVVTKESMYPVFEIDGVEYTAERRFGRFGATIRCRMTHPEELEKEMRMVPEGRRKRLRFFYRCLLPIGLLLYLMAVSGSASLEIIISICVVPILIWVFDTR